MADRSHRPDVTELLAGWRDGSPEGEAQLLAAVHHELRRIAAGYMRRERRDHSLQPTALVNEAYLRLAGQRGVQWEGRAHFFGIAARVMRQVLVDHARRRRALKRPPGRPAITASRIPDPTAHGDVDVLALHEALEQLAALDPRQAEIVSWKRIAAMPHSAPN